MPRSASALIAAAALIAGPLVAGAGPVSAATVIQTVSFDTLHSFVTHEAAIDATETTETPLHFQAFDIGLGALTGAQWRLSSNLDYGAGVSLLGPGGIALFDANASGSILLNGTPLGLSPLLRPQSNLACSGAAGCLQVAHVQDAFGFELAASDLTPFQAPGGLDPVLVSRILLRGGAAVGSDVIPTFTGGLEWSGSLKLAYTYEPLGPPPPTGVPEPMTWSLMVLGFGLTGAALRWPRRRRRPL
jgi:hypothetical protein